MSRPAYDTTTSTAPERRVASLLNRGRPITEVAADTGWTADEVAHLASQLHISLREPADMDSPATTPDLERLLTRARQCAGAHFTVKADRIQAMIAELAADVREYESQAAARAEVAELEAKLAAARAKLPAKRASGRGNSDASDIRAWAKARGVEISERGRVPARVVEQYRQAQAQLPASPSPA